MVPWVQQGHQYHLSHDLKSCLYCGEAITEEREELLTAAFDDKLSEFTTELNTAAHHAGECAEALNIARAAIPAAAQLSAEFQPPFEAAASAFTAGLDNISPLLMISLRALRERKGAPTSPVVVALPALDEIKTRVKLLEECCEAVNSICKQHADMVDDFNEHQRKARETIRRHFVLTSADEYVKHLSEISSATEMEAEAERAVEKLQDEMAALRANIQQHGPAADKINALIKSYLGHSELTIVAIAEGYELHRHGALVAGAPSEGEKTAIALCYFLSTLEAEDRKIKNLIIVIDDPVSSS